MVQICQGAKSKANMLEETIVQYKEMFIITRREFEKVVSVCLLCPITIHFVNWFAECPSIP
jgi:DNA topoisomerase-3